MKPRIILLGLLIVGNPVAGHGQNAAVELVTGERVTISHATRITLQAHFIEFDVIRLDVRALAASVKRGQITHRLRIDNVIDQDVSIELRDLRSPNYKLYVQDANGVREVVSEYRPNTYLLRDATQVEIGRLNLDEDTFEARIRTGTNIYYVRNLSKFAAATEPDVLVVNRLQDAAQAESGVCDAEPEALPLQTARQVQATSGGGNAEYETCVQLEIAGAGDYTLFNIHGVFGTESTVFETINPAEHIYLSEFGLPFTVTGNIVSVTDDPYDSSNSHTLLKSFKDHWNELGIDIKRDVAILVSGKNLEGGTKGRAYIGVAGFPDKAYGVVQSPGTDHLDYVVAHEIGHSLGAQHDESGCAHLLANNRWIMCPWVGTKDFSGGSRSSIINYVNAHLDLFVSEYTLTTSAYVDGNFIQGELHAGGDIIADEYFLDDPAYDVTLVSRTKIVLKANTRVTHGANLRARIDPNLHCTPF